MLQASIFHLQGWWYSFTTSAPWHNYQDLNLVAWWWTWFHSLIRSKHTCRSAVKFPFHSIKTPSSNKNSETLLQWWAAAHPHSPISWRGKADLGPLWGLWVLTPGHRPPVLGHAETSGQQGCDRNLSRPRESACQGPWPSEAWVTLTPTHPNLGEEHPYWEQRLESSLILFYLMDRFM